MTISELIGSDQTVSTDPPTPTKELMSSPARKPGHYRQKPGRAP